MLLRERHYFVTSMTELKIILIASRQEGGAISLLGGSAITKLPLTIDREREREKERERERERERESKTKKREKKNRRLINDTKCMKEMRKLI